jgi:hypothetical protein
MPQVYGEDDNNFLVQTDNGQKTAINKKWLASVAGGELIPKYQSKLAAYQAAQAPTGPTPAPSDLYSEPELPSTLPTGPTAAPQIPISIPNAAQGAEPSIAFVQPATQMTAPQQPQMPMQMTTMREEPGMSTTQKSMSPEADKALNAATKANAEAITAQTTADIKAQEAFTQQAQAQTNAIVESNRVFQENEKTRLNRLQEAQDGYSGAVADLASSKVDPSKLFQEKSTATKLGLGIAVALGAIGQTLARGNSNYALDVIDKAIDTDIAAQKANIGIKGEAVRAKENAFSMLRTKLGDERMAELALKDAAIEKVKGDFMARISATKSDQIKAAGQKMIADLSQKQAELRASATGVATTMTAGGTKQSVTVESGKAGIRNEDPLWTSFGRAPDAEAAKTIRAADAAYKEGAGELQNYQNKIKEIGTLSPYKWGTKEKGAWEAATESVKNTLRQVKNMGVLQPSESKELENKLGGIKTPSQLNAYAKELEGWLERSMNSKLTAYGIGSQRKQGYTPASFAGR